MYLIAKDGLWLMGCQPSGIRESVGGHSPVNVPVCVWGEHQGDAMPFEDVAQARRVARAVGALVVKI